MRKQLEKVAMIYGVRVLFYVNKSGNIRSKSGRVIKVDTYPEAVDESLIRQCARDDIVITQDSNLAAKCLAHEAYVVNPSGWLYTEATLLKKNPKKAKKKTKDDDKNFEWLLGRVEKLPMSFFYLVKTNQKSQHIVQLKSFSTRPSIIIP